MSFRRRGEEAEDGSRDITSSNCGGTLRNAAVREVVGRAVDGGEGVTTPRPSTVTLQYVAAKDGAIVRG